MTSNQSQSVQTSRTDHCEVNQEKKGNIMLYYKVYIIIFAYFLQL